MLRGFAKKLYIFYKKTHFRLYKKQKTESQGSPSVRFFCFMLYRGWGAAFYQTPAAPPLRRCVLPYPCHAAAVAPRFAISLPRRRCGTAFCHIPATPRLGCCVLSDLCHAAAGTPRFVRPLPRCRLSCTCAALCRLVERLDFKFCPRQLAAVRPAYRQHRGETVLRLRIAELDRSL